MGSHLDAFIAYGCNNKEYLEAMATWSDKEINMCLTEILEKGGKKGKRGVRVTEMKIFVLRRNIREQFQ